MCCIYDSSPALSIYKYICTCIYGMCDSSIACQCTYTCTCTYGIINYKYTCTCTHMYSSIALSIYKYMYYWRSSPATNRHEILLKELCLQKGDVKLIVIILDILSTF